MLYYPRWDVRVRLYRGNDSLARLRLRRRPLRPRRLTPCRRLRHPECRAGGGWERRRRPHTPVSRPHLAALSAPVGLRVMDRKRRLRRQVEAGLRLRGGRLGRPVLPSRRRRAARRVAHSLRVWRRRALRGGRREERARWRLRSRCRRRRCSRCHRCRSGGCLGQGRRRKPRQARAGRARAAGRRPRRACELEVLVEETDGDLLPAAGALGIRRSRHTRRRPLASCGVRPAAGGLARPLVLCARRAV
mmetsp:Transcript_21887/g.72536  ORF Transcript_21887/g.72536 Transcript_21887/m.72536 type:complete len:247 (-) Transcript_21887:484-1224(-)